MSTNTLTTLATGLAMLLLVASVWTADVSVSTALGMTALLLFVSAGLVSTAREVGSRVPEGAEAEQRERMRARVP